MHYRCQCRRTYEEENYHLPTTRKALPKGNWDKISRVIKWVLLIAYLVLFIVAFVQLSVENARGDDYFAMIACFVIFGIIGLLVFRFLDAVIRFCIRHWLLAIVIIISLITLMFFRG